MYVCIVYKQKVKEGSRCVVCKQYIKVTVSPLCRGKDPQVTGLCGYDYTQVCVCVCIVYKHIKVTVTLVGGLQVYCAQVTGTVTASHSGGENTQVCICVCVY